ncbi:MAG TPA: 3-phosphoshikimate 1-carboxyvinyltransferase [Gaiellaceae bacterium]|jgi:3-phosphoshikimate 1-carboxyvinyltransferase|nr:3-phosphoshikimate 1-carboxyvinyltransferase [Gaiellaceae bacterium]
MKIEPASRLDGHIGVPGDKSVSHRALLIGALTEGETRVSHWGRSGDTESTLGVVRALGVRVDEEDVDTLVVHGVGLRGLRAPEGPLDCGNAGTLVRLISGILAFQEGRFELSGDESLSRRPMGRIVLPLARMGAALAATDGCLPMTIEGSPLTGIDYTLPVASAQVKSAILLAGLGAHGRTTVNEPTPTRDHTELMLESAGAKITRRSGSVSVEPGGPLSLPEVLVPGDISSAAPFLAAAAVLPGSTLTVHDLGLNPLRTGLLDVLTRMGARVGILNKRRVAGELIGDVEVTGGELVATTLEAAEIPRLVDEVPLVALLASMAHGTSRITGAEELRAKETDRIDATTTALRAMGQHVEATADGFVIRGVPARPRGGSIDAARDHRIAMLGAVAGVVSREGVRVADAECAAISFPGFYDVLRNVARSGDIG